VWSDDRYWRQLSLDQQHAAENIGYTQEVLSPFSTLACLRSGRSIAASLAPQLIAPVTGSSHTLSRVASLCDRPAPAPTMSTFGALQCQACRTKRYLANPDHLGCRRSGMVRVTFTTDRGSLSAMCSANRPLSLATTRTSGIGALARRLSDTLNPSFYCALPWICFEPVPLFRRVANACPSNQTVGVLFPERPFPSADTPCRTADAIHRHILLTFILKSVQRSLCAG